MTDLQKAAIEEKTTFKNDDNKLRSAAFAVLVVKTLLDLTEEAIECLTEGGGDFGIDAIEVGDVQDSEFSVTIFQGKYKTDLEGTSNFPQSGIEKLIQTV